MVEKLIDLSIGELKALAYDLIVSREQLNNKLQSVNQALAQKINSEKDKVLDKVAPKTSKSK